MEMSRNGLIELNPEYEKLARDRTAQHAMAFE